MKTVVLCSSAAFYKHLNELADNLEKLGHKAIVPRSAREMRASNNYDVSASKTWYDNPADFDKKRAYMHDHFKEIADGDVVLVVNDDKRGIKGYIGPNALMEMGLAFYLHKPIYILNAITKEMPIYEEVIGMGSRVLNGDLSLIE